MSTKPEPELEPWAWILIAVGCLSLGGLILVGLWLFDKKVLNKPAPPVQEEETQEEPKRIDGKIEREPESEIPQFHKHNTELEYMMMGIDVSERYMVEPRRAKRVSRIINQYPKGTLIRNNVTVF